MKKILVTGASGFVGTHLIEQLVQDKNNDVYAAVYGHGSDLAHLIESDHIISGDLTDAGFAMELVDNVQPHIVYHLAALAVVQVSVEKAGKILTSNIQLQYNILEAVKKHAPNARFIAVCSAHEYGLVQSDDVPINENTPLRPLSPYAVSKVAQDMLAYQYFLADDLDIVRLRPFNHTGEGQTADFVIPALAKQFVEIKAGKKEARIEVGNTESIRDFTDVKDMVRAYILAAEKGEKGEVYNIGFGKGSSIREIIHLFEEIAGIKVEVITKNEIVRHSDVPILICDASKFKAVTGWEPSIKLKETLTRVYNYREKLGSTQT